MRRSRYLDGTGLTSHVARFGRRSLIKSIQRGTVAVASAALTGTATITAVDLSNSVLVYGGQQTDNSIDTWHRACARIELTNATTITATRFEVGEIQTVTYEVIEFWPGVIKSVQRGTITMTAVNNATATITAVNTSKSMLGYLGYSQENPSTASTIMTRLTLTNSTTVTANRATGTLNVIIGYQVVEFY